MIVHKVPTFTKYQSEPNEDIHDQKLINSIIQNLFQSIHDIPFFPNIQTFISIMSCKTWHACSKFIHSCIKSIDQSIQHKNKQTNKLSIIHHSIFNIHKIKTNKHKQKNLRPATFTLIIMWFHSFIHSLIAFPNGDKLDDCPQGSNIHEISKWAKWRHS